MNTFLCSRPDTRRLWLSSCCYLLVSLSQIHPSHCSFYCPLLAPAAGHSPLPPSPNFFFVALLPARPPVCTGDSFRVHFLRTRSNFPLHRGLWRGGGGWCKTKKKRQQINPWHYTDALRHSDSLPSKPCHLALPYSLTRVGVFVSTVELERKWTAAGNNKQFLLES
jgi:hypothetical protein